ncbi:ParA family protein [Sinanaerobacter chloroacetimidivorans]|jgi:chromosome partitioning protein|uniref:Sporulation initiation inhibitor protein Soj n=1 Tax=Sinanaerobacter chloroacetimidivorans TaxID=2818044 RepID=A0A8J7VYS4_9FIRM|nr:ParA family protein [Sinanaerobacter chloroacetimidivorans]MBR0597554.1 ParA family protein [Sinanaerobacter chloroacetimidivorans]
MSKTVVITNQKGGVGKTSTASAIISGLAEKGYKTLAIDLDPQGNLGFCLGAEIDNSPTVYELMKGTVSIDKIIQNNHGIDIIPSNILLSGAELEFSQIGREYLLKKGIAPIVDQYDYIIIDTPPALNILTVNAYTATDNLIIPMVPEILSLLGISQLSETIALVKNIYNPKIEVLGILLNKYDKRRLLTKDVEEMAEIIAKELNTKVFETKIRSSVAVAEAPAHGESIYQYAPRATSTKDYRNFVEELISEKGMKLDGKEKQ